jgi:hypothetical protein
MIILIKIMDSIKLIGQPSHSTSFVLEEEDQEDIEELK